MRLPVRFLVLSAAILGGACNEPRSSSGELADCCVAPAPVSPAASVSAAAMATPADTWKSLLAAMRGGDSVSIAQLTTPAGLASLRAGVKGEPEYVTFARWGKGWSEWEVRWKPEVSGKIEASLGPEAKEHGLVFVKAPEGWKLDRWAPGE